MKKNLLKTMLAAILSVACLIGIPACTQNEPTEEPSETTNDTQQVGLVSFGLQSVNDNSLSFYLSLDGIEGESRDSKHEKWIDVLTFSHGVSQDVSNSLYTEQSSLEPVVFTHKVDKATPILQKYCMNGTFIKTVKFNATKAIAGVQTLVYDAEFKIARVVNTEVKTATDKDGTPCMIEEVTMLVDSGTYQYSNEDRIGSYSPYYLSLDGIEGSSQDSKHANWIDVIDFSHGAVQETQTEPPYFDSDAAFSPIVFTHRVDPATPKILKYCQSGTIIRDGQFDATKNIAGKQNVVYKVTFGTLKIIKAVVKTVTDEDGSTYLVEEVTMLANKETWTSSAIGLDNTLGGNTEASFDQSKKA